MGHFGDSASTRARVSRPLCMHARIIKCIMIICTFEYKCIFIVVIIERQRPNSRLGVSMFLVCSSKLSARHAFQRDGITKRTTYKLHAYMS